MSKTLLDRRKKTREVSQKLKEKLITIFGTRPEIIRLSRIIPRLDEHFDHKMINTYQNHLTNLNDIFVNELGIRRPDYNLKINHDNYGKEISDIISQVWTILNKERPDKILVLGDTYSCLSVMPASNLGIKIYHMEAGMRSGDWRMPEEKNRRIVDHLATINLPYTENSRQNLLREGIDPLKIFVSGNPIIEVLDWYENEINNSKILEKLNVKENKYYMATIHRIENVSNSKALKSIIRALEKIYMSHPKDSRYDVLVFAHPRLLESMEKFNLRINPKIRLRKNIGFFDFVKLQKHAKCVLTDSGTVPEECSYFKRPCVTIRNSTERPEFVDLGTNIISGTNKAQDIVDAVKIATESMSWNWEKSLGDGRTSERVLKVLKGAL